MGARLGLAVAVALARALRRGLLAPRSRRVRQYFSGGLGRGGELARKGSQRP